MIIRYSQPACRFLQQPIKKLQGLVFIPSRNKNYKFIKRPQQLRQADAELMGEAFERLSKAHSYFEVDVPLRRGANACYKYYKDKDKNLLLDIMLHLRSNQQFLNFLMECYPKSRTVRVLVLTSLMRIIVDGNDQVTMGILWTLRKNNLLSPIIVNDFDKLLNNYKTLSSSEFKSAAGSAFITHTAASGEPLLAASLALTLDDMKISLSEQLATILLRTLCVENNQRVAYNSYTILKLTQAYEGKFITTFDQLALVLDFMLKEKESAYFVNVTFNKLAAQFESNPKFLEIVLKVAEKNVECMNFEHAIALLQKYAFPERIDEVSPELLKTLIQALIEVDERELLSKLMGLLPEQVLANPELVDQSLKYYGTIKQNVRKFEHLVKELQPPLDRLTLSVLFESFLIQNNEVAADRFLETILNSKHGVTHKDFNAIINKLLSQGNLESSISMINKTEVHVAKKAYVSVLKYVLHHENVDGKVKSDFMNKLIKQFKRLSLSDDTLGELTRVLMRYLLNNINNRLSRRLYEIHSSDSVYEKRATSEQFSFQRFLIPDEMNSLIRINGNNRLLCLKIIGKRAVMEQDLQLLKWTIEEMRTVGGTLPDILAFFNQQDPQFMESLLKDEVLDILKQL